jgi:hypothetical protein
MLNNQSWTASLFRSFVDGRHRHRGGGSHVAHTQSPRADRVTFAFPAAPPREVIRGKTFYENPTFFASSHIRS